MSLSSMALLAGVTVSTVVDLQKRIIGGQDCGQKERPYHVKLRITDGTHEMFCGGSLISDRWILTAAHCQEPGCSMTVVLGSHPGPETEVQITTHEIFRDNRDRPHDIMLVRLSHPTNIIPVRLPDCAHRPNIGDTVQIAGHGPTAAGPQGERDYVYLDEHVESSTLQCADTTVVDCQRVRELVGHIDPDKLYQDLFCGQRHGVDTCPGDSGGGVVRNGMIYGVISFSGDSDYVCREPAAFMNVCEYISWINGVITRH
ncbi:hypothetical protein ABVT39_013551 [Epinephelus coioides]